MVKLTCSREKLTSREFYSVDWIQTTSNQMSQVWDRSEKVSKTSKANTKTKSINWMCRSRSLYRSWPHNQVRMNSIPITWVSSPTTWLVWETKKKCMEQCWVISEVETRSLTTSEQNCSIFKPNFPLAWIPRILTTRKSRESLPPQTRGTWIFSKDKLLTWRT